MQINIVGRHVEITPALKDYVQDKFQRIEKKFEHITNVHVSLEVESKIHQKASATINMPKGQVHATSGLDKDMYKCIDTLVDKLAREVIKHKEMMQDKHVGDKS